MATKKEVAKLLTRLADTLPLVFDLEYEKQTYTGEEMNLSGYGQTMVFDNKKQYELDYPVLRAVEHRKQLKDIWNKNGMNGVTRYCEEVKANQNFALDN